MSNLDEFEIRRLYIDDKRWKRTSSSWKALKPRRNSNGFDEGDESARECFIRLNKAGFHIPYLVIEQWIYPHYYKEHTVDNYAWIDYGNVSFVEATLPVEVLSELNVIEDFRSYVDLRSNTRPFQDFMCIPTDLTHWQTQGTWRVPPVVLDVPTFGNVPLQAEIAGRFQLIEGHSRLGYLYALENAGMLEVREHTVFLLSNQSELNHGD